MSIGWQIGIGGLLGGASYIADSYATDSQVTIDELVLSALGGAWSGWFGKHGANYKMSLTDTIENFRTVVAREARRANQMFAKKAVASAKYYAGNTIAKSAWNASARFSVGNSISSMVNLLFGGSR